MVRRQRSNLVGQVQELRQFGGLEGDYFQVASQSAQSRALQAPDVEHRIMKVATTRWDFPQGHAGEQSARTERIVGQP